MRATMCRQASGSSLLVSGSVSVGSRLRVSRAMMRKGSFQVMSKAVGFGGNESSHFSDTGYLDLVGMNQVTSVTQATL